EDVKSPVRECHSLRRTEIPLQQNVEPDDPAPSVCAGMFLIPAQRPDTTPLIPDGAERNQTRPPACAFAAMHAAGHALCAVLQALADWHRRKSEVYAIIDVRIRDGCVWLEQGSPMRTRERLSGKSLLP